MSIRERDQTRASARAASANVRKARAAIEIAEQTLKASISGAACRRGVEIAQATLHRAEIDTANTEIVAPGDGRVSEAGVRLGQYVTAGTQLPFPCRRSSG